MVSFFSLCWSSHILDLPYTLAKTCARRTLPPSNFFIDPPYLPSFVAPTHPLCLPVSLLMEIGYDLL